MSRDFEFAIIDLDLPIFKAAASAQKTWYDLYDKDGELVESFPSAADCKAHLEELEDFLGEDTSQYTRKSRIVVAEFQKAVDALDTILKEYMQKARAKQPKYFIGGDSATNFRHEVATLKGYKSGRPPEKPHHFYDLVKHAKQKYNPVVADGVECDDLVSIAIYKDYLRGLKTKDNSKCQCVLVSIDKDSKVTPGWHLNPDKDSEPVWISTKEARLWLYTMCIGGDQADAIIGAPGYGYKKAEQALEGLSKPSDLWAKTLEVFEAAYRKECAKPKKKDKNMSIDDDANLTYTDCHGEIVTKSIADVAHENMELVYMLRKSTDERWERPE